MKDSEAQFYRQFRLQPTLRGESMAESGSSCSRSWVAAGQEQLPMLWSHIPNAAVSDTSNTLYTDIGTCSGFFVKWLW